MDVDDFVGDEVFEVAADAVGELAGVELGVCDPYAEVPVEQGAVAVLGELHAVVECAGGQGWRAVAVVAVAFAAAVQGCRLPQVAPGDQCGAPEPAGQDGGGPGDMRSLHLRSLEGHQSP